MILLNLASSKSKEKKDNTFPLAMGLISLVLVSLFIRTLSVPALSPRALEIEEREVVIGAVERLENETPQLSQWAEALKVQLERTDFPIYLSMGNDRSHLIEFTRHGITVSPLFFEVDPITQQSSIAQVVAGKNSLPHIISGEIAFVPAE